MCTSFSTSSSERSSTRYGPMRQYCSSRMRSSIQPLPGVWSSGWLRKKRKRPPGVRTRPTSARASSTASMCSKTRQATTASNDSAGNGSVSATPRQYAGGPPRSRATDSCAHVGSSPTTLEAPTSPASREIWPSPQPMSSTDAQPRRSAAAMGTICSTYSGSAPAVNPSCHQAACFSHSFMRSRCRTVELGVQRVGHLLGQPGDRLQVLEAGLLHGRDAAQVLQQALLPSGPEAGDVVDGALGHALAAELAVIGDGEAVGLIADALQEVERLGLAPDADGVGLAGHVPLLEALGQ